MREIGKIKLNRLNKAELEQREMNALKGGCSCPCPCICFWDGSGDNANEKQSTQRYAN